MYTRGKKLVEQGEYDQGIQLLYQQIDADPAMAADSWREMGVAYFEQGDLIKAEDVLKTANSIRPDARTSLYLGLVFEKQEMYGKAIDAYRASLALNPGGKTKDMIRSHLDVLIAKKMQQEVSQALAHESAIDVDTIPDNTIAVVDFDDTHLPPDLAPISKGLAEFTAMDLAKIKSLKVVDRLKIDAIMNELKLGASGYVNPATAPRMGRLMGSNRIVTGTVLGIGDEAIQIDGAVVKTRDSSSSMTGAAEGQLDKFFEVEKDFVMKVVDNLGITLTAEERDSIRTVPTESYLAFMAYCRGLDLRSRGMYDAAANEFQQAVDADKGFEEAGVQMKAAAAEVSGDEAGAFQKFEAELTSASGEKGGDEGLGRFQAGSLASHNFIRDPGNLDQFGNTPDSPDRTVDIEGFGTVTIRGNLDAQP